ncbi:hypothetical protein MM1S1540310_2402 [Mycobacteroides abscessus subsp. bolletii 1S-154-0310]|uniref:Uncharacterized protein n=1 Tax=Mycobacteroides abscessus MAB_091912_2446 TaxID=1335414 RepID=A0A829MGV8_9MYCO|nr:hypothetical protein MM1S1510930_2848 [Mycobacteroides abscessus subsp. bolletii 1S-151-0930]EIU69827.1 hypothetical protein MM1S1520914_3052 [Mycobacteroides abscessus subsp. bolletii 1S-152-0914]EIU75409.1 hypothetical protein MM1S1530915_2391 [Mycobacteroides abscessus subsp. bolletii 1S-153-0915]EIU79639.1 hypothetical protein MM1S1540310_2402 [Mycobacteroides abscessus subsp. bolletii 1S-154-0310]EIU83539.1 hypothetical protein MM2B0626_2768 [Mycobacteroides abscessus subsp. bolletii 2B
MSSQEQPEDQEPQLHTAWVPVRISSLPIFTKDDHRIVGESE